MWGLAILFTAHYIADFRLQTREMALKKKSDMRFLAKHGLVIFYVFLLTAWFPLGVGRGILFAIFNCLTHGLIDGIIWNVYKKSREGEPKDFDWTADPLFWHTLGLDQLLHGLTIIGLYGLFS